jgi:hypothetical protein
MDLSPSLLTTKLDVAAAAVPVLHATVKVLLTPADLPQDAPALAKSQTQQLHLLMLMPPQKVQSVAPDQTLRLQSPMRLPLQIAQTNRQGNPSREGIRANKQVGRPTL